MPQPCVGCATPTEQTADVSHPHLRVSYANRPFCGRPCVLVHLGDDINDLVMAQSGLDAAASRHMTLQTSIEAFAAELDAAHRETTALREDVSRQMAAYRRWVEERRELLQRKEDNVRRMTIQLDAMRVEERQLAQTMETLSQRMSKLRRRLEHGDRRDNDGESTRQSRMRFAGLTAASSMPEPTRPLFSHANDGYLVQYPNAPINPFEAQGDARMMDV